jgi:hypothetical protein
VVQIRNKKIKAAKASAAIKPIVIPIGAATGNTRNKIN